MGISWVTPFVAGATSSFILVLYLWGNQIIDTKGIQIMDKDGNKKAESKVIDEVQSSTTSLQQVCLNIYDWSSSSSSSSFSFQLRIPTKTRALLRKLTCHKWFQKKTKINPRADEHEEEDHHSPRAQLSWERHSEKMKIFDSTSLDKRILRKAECALIHRTSRLILVIERCTNDHNYSAILRTAEALGIQHVWIISPQSVVNTLSMDPEKILSVTSSLESIHGSNSEMDDITFASDLTQPTINHNLFWIDNDNLSSDTMKSPNETMVEEEDDEEVLGYISLIDKSSSTLHDDEGKIIPTTAHIPSSDKTNMTLYQSNGLLVRNATLSDIHDRAQHHLFAQKATEWLSIREFDTTSECIQALRKEEYTIWSTDLSQVAVPLTEGDLISHNIETSMSPAPVSTYSPSSSSICKVIPDKLAIVFGTESVGCTQEILQKSDLRVYLPLYGFADSLNLSVAVALVIHQLFTLDPTLRGAMPEEERLNLRRMWYTKLAKQRILTSSQKQQMKRLVSKIQRLERLQVKVETESNKFSMKQKDLILVGLKELDSLRTKLQTLQLELDLLSRQSIEDLILHPPQPLDDMRRADEHRITYISKNMRKKNEAIWTDMPAVQYVNTIHQENNSCSVFRSRARTDTSLDSILNK